jgi:hypothetical protein
MTKGRVEVTWKGWLDLNAFGPETTFHRTVALSFVIPVEVTWKVVAGPKRLRSGNDLP